MKAIRTRILRAVPNRNLRIKTDSYHNILQTDSNGLMNRPYPR
jgi:hypothetical protein